MIGENSALISDKLRCRTKWAWKAVIDLWISDTHVMNDVYHT